ncbi:hypothetical protein [Mesorhizobium sp. M0644]|uniref:hypothetical protein n=1 Tax=Mesorhizobium sp. M0644 TaxID=2956979 RepID=UPI00333A7CEF
MRYELEVADISRRNNHAYRVAHDGHLGRVERRVMSAIELCRTAAPGGHVEGREDCAHARVCYNSLYGDFSVKSLVRLSAIISLSLLTAGAWAQSGAVDHQSEAGVNPDREQGEQFEGSLPWGAKHRAATFGWIRRGSRP